MVEIDHKIIITGILALTLMFIILIIFGDNDLLCYTIVGVIALAIGVVIPVPKIDNQRGLLRW